MRLINVDAFIQRLREDCEDKATIEYIAEIHDLLEIEATFHPVEAEPIRHGKWKYKEFEPSKVGVYVCSECGYVAFNKKVCHYCYNCGAKMEGVEE